MENKTPLLELKNINMFFKKPGVSLNQAKEIHVLRDVNLSIYPGEIVAIIGESGCGKTTLGKIITGLLQPSKGDIYYQGKKINGVFNKKIASYNAVQFVQQDSYAALNPVRTIYQSLFAPIKTIHRDWDDEEIDAKIKEQATAMNKDFEEYKKSMNERQISYFENNATIEKLFAFLTANNKID